MNDFFSEIKKDFLCSLELEYISHWKMFGKNSCVRRFACGIYLGFRTLLNLADHGISKEDGRSKCSLTTRYTNRIY